MSHDGAAATERTAAQRAFRQHDARVLFKRRHPPCCGGCGGLMSVWLPPRAWWSLDPGVRREDNERSVRGMDSARGIDEDCSSGRGWLHGEIGRASCRDRVELLVVWVSAHISDS